MVAWETAAGKQGNHGLSQVTEETHDYTLLAELKEGVNFDLRNLYERILDKKS